MAARLADILNIVGPDTFLRVCNSRIVRLYAAVKIGLQRSHTRINPQQGRVIMGYKRSARLDFMAFAFEKKASHLERISLAFIGIMPPHLINSLAQTALPPFVRQNPRFTQKYKAFIE